jgi:hypothetical protein
MKIAAIEMVGAMIVSKAELATAAVNLSELL